MLRCFHDNACAKIFFLRQLYTFTVDSCRSGHYFNGKVSKQDLDNGMSVVLRIYDYDYMKVLQSHGW